MQDLQQDTQASVSETSEQVEQNRCKDLPFEDERYPGSFFKVPGVPRPGKTSWRST